MMHSKEIRRARKLRTVGVLLGYLAMAPLFLLFADGYEILTWVRYDSESGVSRLSTGETPPQGAVPGQYYEKERGRLKREKQWRSPLDFLRTFSVKEGRVEFSHERHFAAMGKKSCTVCHDEAKGLGSEKYPSVAKGKSGEPHSEASMGRFCSVCHNGRTRTGDLEGALSKADKTVVFTALGRSGEPACNRCHVPADHGKDFTSGHGDRAEHKGTASCSECHRGADRLKPGERALANQYRQSQLALVANPEDEKAFSTVLPANFCLYCHNSDNEPWEHGPEGKRSERRERD